MVIFLSTFMSFQLFVEFEEQNFCSLHSASLNNVHVVLRPGVVTLSTERSPEVAPQTTNSSYHRCHNGPTQEESQTFNHIGRKKTESIVAKAFQDEQEEKAMCEK